MHFAISSRNMTYYNTCLLFSWKDHDDPLKSANEGNHNRANGNFWEDFLKFPPHHLLDARPRSVITGMRGPSSFRLWYFLCHPLVKLGLCLFVGLSTTWHYQIICEKLGQVSSLSYLIADRRLRVVSRNISNINPFLCGRLSFNWEPIPKMFSGPPN